MESRSGLWAGEWPRSGCWYVLNCSACSSPCRSVTTFLQPGCLSKSVLCCTHFNPKDGDSVPPTYYDTHKTARCHNPAHHSLNSLCHENLSSHILKMRFIDASRRVYAFHCDYFGWALSLSSFALNFTANCGHGGEYCSRKGAFYISPCW